MEDLQNSLNELKRDKANMEKERREIIYQLKNIMLNEDNHIDNSFNNKLKTEKEQEYINLLKKLKEMRKEKFEGNKEDINKKMEQLYDQKINNIFLRKNKEQQEDKANEDKREKILKKTISFLRDNGMIENGINQLKSYTINTIYLIFFKVNENFPLF